MWPVAEDIVRNPDVSAWKSALYDGLRLADGFHVLSVDGTMKIAMGVRRRDAGTPLTPGGSQRDHHVDHNTCVPTNVYVARCCLGPCRGPQRQQTPRCRARPGERGAPRSGGCALGGRGKRIASVARRWSFPSLRGVPLDTCHLPMEYEAVASNHGSAGSRMLGRLGSKFNVSFPSEVCPDVDALEPFRGERNRQFTGDEVFFCNHLCRASLPQEQTDAAVTSMKSADVWSGLAEWIRAPAAVATLYPEEMKNKHSQKGK